MRERPKIAVIVKPAAHKGGAGKRWPAIQAELVRRRLGMLFGVMPKLYGETVGRLPLDVSVLPGAFLVGTVS